MRSIRVLALILIRNSIVMETMTERAVSENTLDNNFFDNISSPQGVFTQAGIIASAVSLK